MYIEESGQDQASDNVISNWYRYIPTIYREIFRSPACEGLVRHLYEEIESTEKMLPK